MSSIKYLSLEQIILIHDNQIELYGGSHGIGRIELLESSLMRPQTTFSGKDLYPTIFDKGAATMHSLIMNHSFIDGNKRTASVSTIVFLELNGYKLNVGQKELIDIVFKVINKKWNIGKLSSWLRKNSRKI